MNLEKKSKWLSFVLRHKPESAGLALDKEGYCSITDVIEASLKSKVPMSLDELYRIVDTDEKSRYSFKDGKIRANQGHSTSSVDLKFKVVQPPFELFHGTTESSLSLILKEGLKPMSRQYVHMSESLQTAVAVGSRRKEKVVILKIDAKAASNDGIKFFVSDNGVWLVEYLAPKYISGTL